MTPERWQQVDQLFYSALERVPGERAAFLDQACDGDVELRREVESLLAAEAETTAKLIPAQVAAEMLADKQAGEVIGRQLSHYRILAPLGKGGMGEVFLAQDISLNRQVALKLLPRQFTADRERVHRFEREARAASALNHPNILTIHEIGQTDETHFIVTEYIQGQTLRQQMKAARMSLPAALEIALQIATALIAAHEAGIIHRDIKPENVMVRQDGIVKVLDFGLAKLIEMRNADFGMRSEDAETLVQSPDGNPQSPIRHPQSTMPGIVMGTPRYMSPEQARGEKVDVRTDIFSLGVMLYEMIAGQAPFAGATPSDVMAAILRDEPLSLSRHLPDCPALLERIVSRCLAKAPAERYQAAAELAAELKAARSAMEERRLSAPAEAQAIVPKTEKTPRWRWAVLGGVVALLVLLAAVYAFRPGRDTTAAPIKTLAVLPPRPLQTGERDEALELGTTSTLITRLGSLRQLIVRPESAVERYASHDQDPLAAGREQKVDAVLDSRYQRVGDKLRFRLRLLRVADGATLWADTLDQQTTDSFAIEDALSAKVTGGLKLTLSEAEKELLAKRYTKSAEAWQLYVRGRQLDHTRRNPDREKAITYLEQAIALDPGFALAHAQLGQCYASLGWVQAPAREFAPKAKAAFDQALKLDDQLAEAHSFLASYKQFYEGDFAGAELEHKRALDLNPNSADARHFYAFHLTYMGRFEQAIPEIRKAEELDPTSLYISRNVAQVFFFARRYDEAIEQSRRVIDLAPDNGAAYNFLARALEMKGDEQSFLAARLKQMEANKASPDEIAGMKAAFASGGLKGYWRWELDRRLAREKSEYAARVETALIYARLGEKEQALARLQRAVEDRNLYIVALNVEPIWDSYRTDPRFMALVRRVGLAP